MTRTKKSARPARSVAATELVLATGGFMGSDASYEDFKAGVVDYPDLLELKPKR